jgi:hypothetical protein
MLPEQPDEQLTAFVKDWAAADTQDPRKNMET